MHATRHTLINALNIAAEQYEKEANALRLADAGSPWGRMRKQFRAQAEAARQLAESIEQAETITLKRRMNMAKYPLTPWTAEDRICGASIQIRAADAQVIALAVLPDTGTNGGFAIAALIAAAPDLLEALQRWDKWARDNDYSTDEAHPGYVSFLAATRAAIAKATGRS